MSHLTWLHLSDWHQKGKDFDRQVLRDALIKDIGSRTKISPDLQQVDFVVFSGDIAFTGKTEEYKAAVGDLLDPLLEAAKIARDRLFVVPGNHDLDRDNFDLLPADALRPFTSDAEVKGWLTDTEKLNRLLAPFETYRSFVNEYIDPSQTAYAYVRKFLCHGRQIALIGLNSALMAGRNKDTNGEVNDYGYLIVGEPQVYEALESVTDADVCIVLMHHPFEWLAEFDLNRIQDRIEKQSDFVLCGHKHKSEPRLVSGVNGRCVMIPAGASFLRRVVTDPRYTNAYNFAHLDFTRGQGVVYLRRWSERRGLWIEDIDSCKDGQFGFSLPEVPKRLPRNRAGLKMNVSESSSRSRRLDSPEHTEGKERNQPQQRNVAGRDLYYAPGGVQFIRSEVGIYEPDLADPHPGECKDTDQYDIRSIRNLIRDAFTAKELWRFCQTLAAFRPVLSHIAPSWSLEDMIDELSVYVEKQMLLPELLSGIKAYNPKQYKRFHDRVQTGALHLQDAVDFDHTSYGKFARTKALLSHNEKAPDTLRQIDELEKELNRGSIASFQRVGKLLDILSQSSQRAYVQLLQDILLEAKDAPDTVLATVRKRLERAQFVES